VKLLAPIALETVAIIAAVLAGLAIVAYILKMRRRRFEVPFSNLWHRVLKEKETTSLWKHLRRILSLLLALIMLGALLFAATEPELGSADDDAKNIVLIIDASASMKARDSGSDSKQPRIRDAIAKGQAILDSLGDGDRAMIVKMDGQTTPLSRFESDIPKLKKLLREVQATDTPADLRRALSAAADALRERQNPAIILVGDGAYPEEVLNSVVWESADAATTAPAATAKGETNFDKVKLDEIDLSKISVSYIPIGKNRENVGIVAFNVRRYIANKLSYEVFIEIQNFGDEPAKRKLVLYDGDTAIDVKELDLKPKERIRKIYPDLGGGEGNALRASLEVPGAAGDDKFDVFPLDDEAFALLPARKRQKVLLVTQDNLYLEGAMLVYDNITVDKLTPAEYEKSVDELDDYSAAVFDDYTPEALPTNGAHILYFNPQGEHSPFPIAGSLERPRITQLDENHPVTRWLVMSDVNFDKSSVFKVNRQARELPLIVSIRSPIAAAKKDGRRKTVAFGFGLTGTDLMLRVAFPLMLVNVLDWFAGDDSDLITTYTTGRRVRVPMDGTYGVQEVEVSTPSGRVTKAPLAEGHATFYASETGVHLVIAKSQEGELARIKLAANLSNPDESDIAPSDELNMGGVTLADPPEFKPTHSQSLWLYLALLALLLLCVEWLTYNRRVTV
jgi:hypothetical protein